MQYFKIAKNTLYQAAARLFSSFIGFLITIFIARYFGVLNYGDFIKITSFVAPFYIFMDFGINAIYLQLDKDEKKFNDLFSLRILISSVIFVIVNVIALLLPYDTSLNTGYPPGVKMGILIFSLSLFSQSIIYSSSAIYQKRISYFNYMIAIILGSVSNFLLVLFFISYKFGLNYIILGFVLSGIITAIISQVLTGKKIKIFKIDINFAKRIILLSWPLGLMLIFNLVYFRIDSIILAFYKSTKDVGIYGLSYKFFDFLIALPLFLSNALYPMLLENQKNFRKMKEIIKSYMFVFALASIFLIIPFWYFSSFFTFIKKDFMDSILPFRILLLSLPFFFISNFLQWILISFKNQKYLMKVYIMSSIINVILNIIFIPKYSYFAAAIITGISEGIIALLLGLKLVSIYKILEKESQYE